MTLASVALLSAPQTATAASDSADGFAAQNGGTTGGAGGAVVSASTGTQIHQAICGRSSTSTPITIQVTGTITVGNTSKVSGSCNTASGVIELKGISNVTIIGNGSAVFDQIGIHIRDSSNIIIRNVTIQNVKKSGSPTSNGGDAIGMESTVRNVWIDHNTLKASGGEDDGYDGLIDMKNDVKYVTVSYNTLSNSGRGGLIGSSESDTGNGPVTFHHNLYSNIESRTPLLRGGTAHIYNNYFVNLTKSGINSRAGAKALVQNNYFKDSKDVLGTFYTDEKGTYQASGNILDNVSWSSTGSENYPAGSSMSSTGSVSVPYSYSLDRADCVPSIVANTAGAGKNLATSNGNCSTTTNPTSSSSSSTTTTTTKTTTTSRPATTTSSTTTTTQNPGGGGSISCTVTTSAWNGGFVSSVTVNNNSSSTVSGWEVTLNYNTSVGTSAAWGATARASGNQITLTGTEWAANLPANGSTGVGVQGTASGVVENPTCSVPGGSQPTSTTSNPQTTSSSSTTSSRPTTTTTTSNSSSSSSSSTTTTSSSSSGGDGGVSGSNLSLGAGADGSSKASGSSFGNVVDGNTGTSWSPSGSTGRVSVKWGSAVTVGAVVIKEASGYAGNIRSWQIVNNDTGATLAAGTNGVGTASFSPVSLKKINFEILAANGTPAVAEFETYGSGSGGSGTTTSTTTSSRSTSTTTTSRSTSTTTSTSSGGDGGTSPTASWPSASSTKQISSTQTISGTYDGNNVRIQGWGGSQSEGQDPLFVLNDGAVLKNVIIGDKAGDGVHCKASCTLINVWWEDVGEDAATSLSSAGSSSVMTIDGGGARYAKDKVFQHNGDGTMVVKNFQAEDFGKLIRHCGNCSTSYQRDSVIQNVVLRDVGDTVVGINTNWGDTATIRQLVVYGDADICTWYKGVSKGSEPSKIGKGPSNNCKYSSSDVTFK